MQLKLAKIANEFLEDTSCFLVEVQEKNDRIKVILDGYNGVDIRLCSRLARHINRLAEEDETIGEFDIEVTSAGVGADINTTNQLKSNVGRLIKLKDIELNLFSGRLIAVDDKRLCITENKALKWFSKTEINSVKVEIEF
ncbi:MAG: ribosome maturation factor RimP [Bacteroidia bacterium]